ncbi:hypothetical protein KUCAC02_030812 [Chaenocephalus aceratus]|uniref:Uncharacterized protein n=1 Tax=Chaenocephalus aceratus TaxID=36190 RepID=A0ACB9XLA2_CHAAC|nr:hypothetical protein KUCAC02_030812 [Chaenocephalus aceratus]
MPGLLYITLTAAHICLHESHMFLWDVLMLLFLSTCDVEVQILSLLACCDAFRVGSSQRVIPLSAPGARVFQDEGPAQAHFIQELVRTKRHSVPELVRVQPHLVHDMGRPEIYETSRSKDKMESDNSSQINPPPPAGQKQSGPALLWKKMLV